MTKTILFLDHTAKLSGGEIALMNLVTALDPARFTPVVLLAAAGPLADRLRRAGVETHVLPLDTAVLETRKDSLGAGSLLLRREIAACAAYAARLAWFARARGADLIHTNSLKSDLYGGLAGRLVGIPVLWHVRDHIDGEYLPRPVAAAFRQLARLLPCAVVANSQSTLQRLRLSSRQQAAVVYSGVSRRADAVLTGDLAQITHDGCYAEARPAVPAPEARGCVVTLMGRIAPWKGQHVFIEAAARVLARFPDTRFLIVGAPLFGEHDYEAALRVQIQRAGIGDRVELLGFRDDVATVLAQTDIVVHASTLGEPFGQVVIEGMAAGKPVVATDGGALPEIVEKGRTGILVPRGDAAAMGDAVASLIADPAGARAMGELGRRRVAERFTIQHTAERIGQVYDTLLSAPARRGRTCAAADWSDRVPLGVPSGIPVLVWMAAPDLDAPAVTSGNLRTEKPISGGPISGGR